MDGKLPLEGIPNEQLKRGLSNERIIETYQQTSPNVTLLKDNAHLDEYSFGVSDLVSPSGESLKITVASPASRGLH